MPRLDAETGHGLVTDVALKRKVRNFVALAKNIKVHSIFTSKKKPYWGCAQGGFAALDIQLGEESRH